MNLQEFMPWNWFKHEEGTETQSTVPVTQNNARQQPDQLSSGQEFAQHPIAQLHRDIDQIFENAFRGFPMPGFNRSWFNQGLAPKAFQAKLDVSSDDKHYHIHVEMPGLEEKDIQLELQKGVLTIRGEKKEESETKDRHFYRTERRYGSFQRVLALPEDVDTDAISATMKNGLLEISLPRTATAINERKSIPIKPAHSSSTEV